MPLSNLRSPTASLRNRYPNRIALPPPACRPGKRACEGAASARWAATRRPPPAAAALAGKEEGREELEREREKKERKRVLLEEENGSKCLKR